MIWASYWKRYFPLDAFLKKEKGPYTTYWCQISIVACMWPCTNRLCSLRPPPPPRGLVVCAPGQISHGAAVMCMHDRGVRCLFRASPLHLGTTFALRCFPLVFVWAMLQGYPRLAIFLTAPDHYLMSWLDLGSAWSLWTQSQWPGLWLTFVTVHWPALQEETLPGHPRCLLWLQAASSPAPAQQPALAAPGSRPFSVLAGHPHANAWFH